MTRRPCGNHRRGDGGQSLVEFALLLPLALAILFGIVTVASIARARYQVALVAHGVTREAAGGMVNPLVLNASARVYARAAGLSPRAALAVTVGAATGAGRATAAASAGILSALAAAARPGTTVTVRALVPVSAPLLRLIPGVSGLRHGWLPITCTSTCLAGTWKSPAAWIKDQLGIKAGTTGGVRG